jgi:hypothetical protein
VAQVLSEFADKLESLHGSAASNKNKAGFWVRLIDRIYPCYFPAFGVILVINERAYP